MSASIFPVILCGGSGTRLWPMSRKLLPKQFLPLASERTLFQEALLRLAALQGLGPCTVVCSEEHRFLAAEQLREIGVAGVELILEPVPRNTAPAIAAGAMAVHERDPGGVVLVLPSDLLIRGADKFVAAAGRASALAREGRLVTFGIVPEGPETGYGYIERGERIGAGAAWSVARFTEKPDRATAKAYLATGRYFWNSGMFVFLARRLLDELRSHRPDIVQAVHAAWQARERDADFVRLGRPAFAACPSESIDYAIMEKTLDAAVVEADFGWSDVGSWSALWEVSDKDADGNVLKGDVDARDSSNSYVRAESRLVSVLGLDGVVVVETPDAVLVAHRGRSQEVKDVVSRLDGRNRNEHVSHRRVYRPWGYYEGLDAGERFQVKRLMVKPHEALSLQLHRRRAEHWVVVSGRARVTRGEETLELEPDQSTYIPIGMKHRLANPGSEPLFVIEVQSGGYLGEDDIERFEDRYRRR